MLPERSAEIAGYVTELTGRRDIAVLITIVMLFDCLSEEM